MNPLQALSTKMILLSTELKVDEILKEDNLKNATSTFGNLETTVTNVGISSYRLVYLAATFIFVVGAIISLIKFFMANSNERNEQKTDLVWKVIAIICAFGTVGMITLFATTGSGLFT